MGILNVTPDLFSDGGQHATHDVTLRHAEQLITEDVDMIDIGGESSRPGAGPLSLQAGLDRVMLIIEVLHECGKLLSIDIYKPKAIQATLDVDADLVDDIWGFRWPGVIKAVAKDNAGLCVMHTRRDPKTMQEAPSYIDLMGKAEALLCTQTEMLMAAGVAAERIPPGPGFGFGKTPDHNLTMLNRLAGFQRIGLLLLAGLPRESTLGAMLGGRPPAERVIVSMMVALLTVERSVFIVRVHGVQPTLETVQLWWAIRHEHIDPPII